MPVSAQDHPARVPAALADMTLEKAAALNARSGDTVELMMQAFYVEPTRATFVSIDPPSSGCLICAGDRPQSNVHIRIGRRTNSSWSACSYSSSSSTPEGSENTCDSTV